MSPKQAPGAETLFLIKMQRVQGSTSSEADKYRGMMISSSERKLIVEILLGSWEIKYHSLSYTDSNTRVNA